MCRFQFPFPFTFPVQKDSQSERQGSGHTVKQWKVNYVIVEKQNLKCTHFNMGAAFSVSVQNIWNCLEPINISENFKTQSSCTIHSIATGSSFLCLISYYSQLLQLLCDLQKSRYVQEGKMWPIFLAKYAFDVLPTVFGFSSPNKLVSKRSGSPLFPTTIH